MEGRGEGRREGRREEGIGGGEQEGGREGEDHRLALKCQRRREGRRKRRMKIEEMKRTEGRVSEEG